MKIKYHKKFLKRFEKLSKKYKKKVVETIKIFSTNPLDKRLRNHKLTGNAAALHAISVTGDMRIIFKEYDKYTLVIMLDVGNHNQVYTKK